MRSTDSWAFSSGEAPPRAGAGASSTTSRTAGEETRLPSTRYPARSSSGTGSAIRSGAGQVAGCRSSRDGSSAELCETLTVLVEACAGTTVPTGDPTEKLWEMS